ncbi:Uncharacterised protein [Mycobacteroides abscessus]|nr:Uncharacterised protein [Mycobacteroides abscessus]
MLPGSDSISPRNRISLTMMSPLALVDPLHMPSCGTWLNRWPSTPSLGSSVTSKRNTGHERSALARRAPVPTGPTQLVTARSCPAMAGWACQRSLSVSRPRAEGVDVSVDVSAHSTCGHTAAGEAWIYTTPVVESAN